MGAYFLKINPLSAAFLQSLQRRLIISSLHQLHVPDRQSVAQGDLTNAQPSPDGTPSTTTSPSNQWKLHLSVTSTHGNRTLSSSSREWKALRNEILLRDNRTCSSCGYLSPYPNGRYMVVDHIDGVASNNDVSNLRIHCPPCDAIRHCGFAGIHDRITVSESTMEQVEIVRKTREIYENTGVIPHPDRIDPSLKPVGISVLEFANMLLRTPWKDLPEELQRLRGFFTEHSSSLFRNTMLVGNLNTNLPNDDSTEALSNNPDRKAAKIAARETSHPSINYSEEPPESSQVFLDSWPPSKTLKAQVPWICVDSRRSAESGDKSPDYDIVSSAWDKICAEGLSTLSEVDKLAEQFNVLSGKWLVFVSPDKVDNLWGRIVKSTLAGTLGIRAKVSTRDEENASSNHVICVWNADYRSMDEVNRIRDELRGLGVTERIPYKPDIYTHCRIYPNNSWGIRTSRYFF